VKLLSLADRRGAPFHKIGLGCAQSVAAVWEKSAFGNRGAVFFLHSAAPLKNPEKCPIDEMLIRELS
jgi:hypothetical protein